MSKPDCHMCDLKQRFMWSDDALWMIYINGSFHSQPCSHHIGSVLETIKDKTGISVSPGPRPLMDSWSGRRGVPITEYEIQRLVRNEWTDYQLEALTAANKYGYLDETHKDYTGKRWNEATLRAWGECLEADPQEHVRYWITEAGTEVLRRLEEEY